MEGIEDFLARTVRARAYRQPHNTWLIKGLLPKGEDLFDRSVSVGGRLKIGNESIGSGSVAALKVLCSVGNLLCDRPAGPPETAAGAEASDVAEDTAITGQGPVEIWTAQTCVDTDFPYFSAEPLLEKAAQRIESQAFGCPFGWLGVQRS